MGIGNRSQTGVALFGKPSNKRDSFFFLLWKQPVAYMVARFMWAEEREKEIVVYLFNKLEVGYSPLFTHHPPIYTIAVFLTLSLRRQRN